MLGRSTARNHHYVPQFYLRNFSSNGRSVRLINLKTRRYVSKASIKGQCKEAGFHDFNPDVERHLGALESCAARAIRDAIKAERLPAEGSDNHLSIAIFVAVQRGRTKQAADVFAATTDRTYRLLLEEPVTDDSDLFASRLKDVDPAAILITAAADVSLYVAKLGMHLFVNRTSAPFISSDNPVIVHNQSCQGIYHRGVLG